MNQTLSTQVETFPLASTVVPRRSDGSHPFWAIVAGILVVIVLVIMTTLINSAAAPQVTVPAHHSGAGPAATNAPATPLPAPMRP